MRELNHTEAARLLSCVKALAEYHNAVSSDFKGSYPRREHAETIQNFSSALAAGTGRIAVVEEAGEILGFCKIDIDKARAKGKLDYLIVLDEFRGKGYGRQLMDWAMEQFHAAQVKMMEVEVIVGNPTIHLYEKYGFRKSSYILAAVTDGDTCR